MQSAENDWVSDWNALSTVIDRFSLGVAILFETGREKLLEQVESKLHWQRRTFASTVRISGFA